MRSAEIVGPGFPRAVAALAVTAAAACFLSPDRAKVQVEIDQTAYSRDASSVIVLTMRNDGGETATLSGTDHIRIDVEHFHDGRWWFESCLGCYARTPPVEVTLELLPGQTHVDSVPVGTWWRLGQYRLAVPYRSAESPRETRRTSSDQFEIS